MLLKSQIEFQIPVDHKQIQLALCKTIDIIFLLFIHLWRKLWGSILLRWLKMLLCKSGIRFVE